VNDLPLPAAQGERPVEARDVLLVEIRNQKDMSGEFTVRDDGHFTQPSVGNIRAAGSTTSQVAAAVAGRLQGVIVDPHVTVAVKTPAPIRVNVVGQVRTPGAYELQRDRTVTAALAAAGWLNEFAGDDDVFVVRPAQQQARIRFRVKELTAAGPHSTRFQLRDGDVVVVE
jgi:polysaccharide export outer membrane protein